MPAAGFIPMLAGALIPEVAAAGGLASFVGGGLLTDVGLGAIAESTVVANVVGGTIIGAGTGALSAAVQGQNVLKGAEMGAVGGGVSDVVSGVLGPALTAEGALGPSGAGGALARGLTSTASGLAGGTAAGVVGGAPLGQAFTGALPGALAGGLATGLVSGVGYNGGKPDALGSLASSGLQAGLTPLLQKAIGGSTSGASASQVPQTYQSGTNLSQTPPSTTSAALSTSPGFAYAPGAPIFGSSDKDSKAPSDVWNTSSLRELGSAVT